MARFAEVLAIALICFAATFAISRLIAGSEEVPAAPPVVAKPVERPAPRLVVGPLGGRPPAYPAPKPKPAPVYSPSGESAGGGSTGGGSSGTGYSPPAYVEPTPAAPRSTGGGAPKQERPYGIGLNDGCTTPC